MHSLRCHRKQVTLLQNLYAKTKLALVVGIRLSVWFMGKLGIR